MKYKPESYLMMFIIGLIFATALYTGWKLDQANDTINQLKAEKEDIKSADTKRMAFLLPKAFPKTYMKSKGYSPAIVIVGSTWATSDSYGKISRWVDDEMYPESPDTNFHTNCSFGG